MSNMLLMDNNRLLAEVLVRLDLNARLMSGSDLSSSDMDIINSAHEDREVVEEEDPSTGYEADRVAVISDVEQHSDGEKADAQPAPVSKVVSKVVRAAKDKATFPSMGSTSWEPPHVEVDEGSSS